MSLTDSEEIDALITVEEINEAILQLKNNKSPGTDGFNNEFNKTFRSQICPLLAVCS